MVDKFNNIKQEGNEAYLEIDLKVYPLKIIYSTSYVFLDRVYIQLLSKDNNVVRIRLKKKDYCNEDILTVADDFLNELIVFADYEKNQEETLGIREKILQRVLLTNDPDSFIDAIESDKINSSKLLDKEFEDFLDELDREEKKMTLDKEMHGDEKLKKDKSNNDNLNSDEPKEHKSEEYELNQDKSNDKNLDKDKSNIEK